MNLYAGIVEVSEVWVRGPGAAAPDDERLQPVNALLQASRGAWMLLDVVAVVHEHVPYTVYILGKSESARAEAEFETRHMGVRR